MGADSGIVQLFYVDCFIAAEREFPVNSYGPGTLDESLDVAYDVLGRLDSGITSVTIGPTTRGMNPRG